ncbi:hypothetical protein HYH03_017095 [Edaphochlamys debaryana]|uniref:FHA domain-containing protein n=1 Tax=Edaphochlamys debaryana TaxID=47281 RepID=A0A836BP88_9CHLO|nr:hypothetical protein HYH03_017095 [Edaphochlamys debaryana]|eukprot:KAG2484076.1 hypothetical protein HYH03_017095 [Edaphochlamys debaryana]
MTDAPGQPQELAREVPWRAGKPALEAVLTLPGGPGPPRACLVLAHGAGGDMNSGHLPRLAQALARGGVGVVRFTHRCTHLPTRVDAYRAVLSAAQGWPETRGTRAWVCAGHSMGSRAACAVAHEASGAEGGSGGPSAAAGAAATRTGRSGKGPAAAANAAEAAAEVGERVQAPARKRRKGGDADAPAPAGGQKRGEAGDAEEAEARPAEEGESAPEAGAEEGVPPGEAPAPAGRRRTRAAAAAESAAAVGAAEAKAMGKGKGKGKARGSAARGDGAAGPGAASPVTAAGDAGGSGGAGAAGGGEARVVGCVFMSYPLHPPGKPAELRDTPLASLSLPLLFVRGSRDEFSTPGPWEDILGRMSSSDLRVHTVEGGDHGLAAPGGRAAAEAALAEALEAVVAFVQGAGSQLGYAQAQLAATEALYAAYQEELKLLRKGLAATKREHLRSGRPLWREGASAPPPRGHRTAEDADPDQEPATFSDIEEDVLLADDADAEEPVAGAGAHEPAVKAEPGAAGQAGRAEAGGASPAAVALEARRRRLMALEATCSAVAQDDMEAQGAVACLAGLTGKHYLRSIVVSLGRATESKGDVDIDLTPEEAEQRRRGRAAQEGEARGDAEGEAAGAGEGEGGQAGGSASGRPRVSRRQALIRLDADGVFRIINTGRQELAVNGVKVPQNHTLPLPHLAMVTVADLALIFMANGAAVQRVVRRSGALVL